METTIRRNIPLLLTIGLFFYVAVPFLAPILMHVRLEQPSKFIYKLYSPLCHQLAYRSWFLFGLQPYYPLADNNHTDTISYDQAFGQPGADFDAARSIIGNKIYGYKIALCQRDIAIYSALFLFGLVFIITGKKIRKVPLFVWLILGVAPLGLDGLTQLFNNLPWVNISSIFLRESTPWLRTITGASFGIFTGWYIYPAIQELVNRSLIEGKSANHENR